MAAKTRESGLRLASGSLRQSLGPPVRMEVAGASGRGLVAGTCKRSLRPPLPGGGEPSKTGYRGPRPSTSDGGQPKRLMSQQQRRQTQVLGGSRVSTGRSSIYGQPSQVKKDPRPLSDKRYQNASIRKLIGYLSEKGYPRPLTVKMLQTPSTKEFLYILNSLDESLVVSGMNIVEEVPRVLKLLRYPFTVSKNHLLNVGSPHSWPILLGALSWLVDCLIELSEDNTSDILFPREHGFSDDGPSPEEVQLVAAFRTEFEITGIMYHVFMVDGPDSAEFIELAEKREASARERYEHTKEEVDRVKAENAALQENIDELSRSSISALQQQIRQNQEDYDELMRYIDTDLTQSIQQLQAEISHNEMNFSETEIQLDACKQSVSSLEDQVRQQPMSATDAHKLLEDIRSATATVDKYRRQIKDGEAVIEELQMQHNRSVLVIDDECRRINDNLRKLGAELPDAAAMLPLDYDTSNRSDPHVIQSLVSHAKRLRQESRVLHQQVAAAISELESQVISGKATQSALHNEQMKRNLEMESVQHTLDIEKEALDKRKMKYEEALKTQQAEKHALEKQLMSLQQRIQTESTVEKELAAVQKMVESETSAMSKDLKERTDNLKKYLLSLTRYLEAHQQYARAYRKRVEELVLKFQKLKVPTVDPKYLARPSVPSPQ